MPKLLWFCYLRKTILASLNTSTALHARFSELVSNYFLDIDMYVIPQLQDRASVSCACIKLFISPNKHTALNPVRFSKRI